ncbi:MAG: GNAT family N-acetyltransferase [Sedimentitalea sp.]
MRSSPDFMRAMVLGEEPDVSALLSAAFKGDDEVQLVKDLRRAGDMMGEQVMTVEDKVIAYAGLCRMVAPANWLCLAPVAVDPEWQGRRIGRRMVGLIAEWARISGTYVVVLGQPLFYNSAGFSTTRASQLTSPYPIDHTALAGPGGDMPKQTLVYAKAFDGL